MQIIVISVYLLNSHWLMAVTRSTTKLHEVRNLPRPITPLMPRYTVLLLNLPFPLTRVTKIVLK